MYSTLAIMLLALLVGGLDSGIDKKIISPPGTKPGGNYSQGILADGTLYISGQGGEDSTGKIPGDLESEVRQSLDNIGTVLKTAGVASADVMSMQVYLTDAASSSG